MNPEHFTSFLESLKTPHNHNIMEAIHQGYQVLTEALFETLHHKLKGTTSKDGGHNHTYTVNDNGNGKTSVDGKYPHHHNVKDWKVKQVNNHIHRLEEMPLTEAQDDDDVNKEWENLSHEEKINFGANEPQDPKRKDLPPEPPPEPRQPRPPAQPIDPEIKAQAMANVRNADRQPPKGDFWRWVQAEYDKLVRR